MKDVTCLGNPLTKLQRHKIIDDSVMFKRGRSAANDFRTVMIEKIPSTSSLVDVMSVIQGDTIFSGQLLQTTPLTGSLTARVVFLEQQFALDFIKYASYNSLSFQNHTARAYLVATPTWPLPHAVYSMGLFKTVTRCLNVKSVPSNFTADAIRFWLDAENCTNPLEPPLIEQSGSELFIWFTSVAAASRARYVLSHTSHFKDLEMNFCADNKSEILGSENKFGVPAQIDLEIDRLAKSGSQRTYAPIQSEKGEALSSINSGSQFSMAAPRSKAIKILEALAYTKQLCQVMEDTIQTDICLVTTQQLKLLPRNTEQEYSLSYVTQKLQRLIKRVKEFSVQLMKSTSIRKTLEDLLLISTRAINFIQHYLVPTSMQQKHSGIFGLSGNVAVAVNQRFDENTTCPDMFIDHLRTTMLLLINLASGIRNRNCMRSSNTPVVTKQTHNNELGNVTVNKKPAYESDTKLEFEGNINLPVSDDATAGAMTESCWQWLLKDNSFITETRQSSKRSLKTPPSPARSYPAERAYRRSQHTYVHEKCSNKRRRYAF